MSWVGHATELRNPLAKGRGQKTLEERLEF